MLTKKEFDAVSKLLTHRPQCCSPQNKIIKVPTRDLLNGIKKVAKKFCGMFNREQLKNFLADAEIISDRRNAAPLYDRLNKFKLECLING